MYPTRKLSIAMLCLGITFMFCLESKSQVIAGIRANGKILSHGDTINVCRGSTIVYQSVAQGSLNIFWRFGHAEPKIAEGIGPFVITYSTNGFDTTFQKVVGGAFADSMFIIVRVSNVKPIAGFSFSPDNVCGNESIQFTNTSTKGAPFSYQWDFNDEIESIDKNPSHQFLTAIGLPGTQSFPVRLITTNINACKDTATKTVTIKKVPDASIGNADNNVVFGIFNGISTFKKCSNISAYTFKFLNLSSTLDNNVSYKIQWGDGQPDSVFTVWPAGAIISHTFPLGSNRMTVSVTGPDGCIGIKKYNVFIGTTPAGGLASLGNTDICSSDSLRFAITNTENNPPGTSYTFSINDGSKTQNFQHAPPGIIGHFFKNGSCSFSSNNGQQTYFNAFGAYLTIENPCGSNSASVVPIYVSGKPRPSISIPSPVVCVNTKITVSNTSSYGNVVTPTGTFSSKCENKGKKVWAITPATGYTIQSGKLGSLNGNTTNGLLWTDGSNSLDILFTSPGIYKLKIYIYNDRCGMDSTIEKICVRNPPTASFVMNKEVSCGPAAVAFTNTSATGGCEGDEYKWEIIYSDPEACAPAGGKDYFFADETTASSYSPVVRFNKTGSYIIRLTSKAINAYGCSEARTEDTFFVKGRPKAIVAAINTACVSTTIKPKATVSGCYSTGPFGYKWIFENGMPSSSTELIPGEVSYAKPGTHAIQFVVTDSSCMLSDTVNTRVTILALPQAEGGNATAICSGETVSLGANSVAGVTYQWKPVAGLSDPAISNPIATLNYNGIASDTVYTFYVKASLGEYCSSVDSVKITVKRKPVVAVTPASAQICFGTTTELMASGAESYTWSPATGLNSVNEAAVRAGPVITTIYSVTGALTNGCTDEKTVTVTVVPEVKAEAGKSLGICNNDTVSLGVPGVAGVSYQWNPVTGLSDATIANPLVTLAYNRTHDTTYKYYLTASLGNCSSFDSVEVMVVRRPVISITPSPAQICFGASTLLTASGSANYQWIPAEGLDNVSGATATVSPSVTTEYTVTGQMANLCPSRKTITVTVLPTPKARFMAPDTVKCSPLAINDLISVVPFAGNNKYNWYADNVLIGSNTTGMVPSYVITEPGKEVNIKLVTLSDFGCKSDSMEKKFMALPSVTAAFEKNKDSACGPLLVSFTNTSTNMAGVDFIWDFGNGKTSANAQPEAVVYYANPFFRDTVYYIVLKAANGCDTSYYRDSVKVFSNAKARFGVDTTRGCSPFTFTIVNTSMGNNDKYYWDFGDGKTDTTHALGTFQHTYHTGSITTYSIRLIAENRCMRDTQTLNIVVSPNEIKPFINAYGDQLKGCAPHTVIFNNSTTGASELTWNFGDNTTPVVTPNDQGTVSHQYTKAGNYKVIIRIKNDCSDTTIERRVQVYDAPKAAFDLTPEIICRGQFVSAINQSLNANAYEWFWGDGATSSFSSGQHSYTDTGVYNIILVARNVHTAGFVCTDTVRKSVTVVNRIPAQINIAPGRACLPYTLKAEAVGVTEASRIEWVVYDSSSVQKEFHLTGHSAVHLYDVAGSYSVRLIVHTAAGCTDTAIYNFEVFNTPRTEFGPRLITTCEQDTTINFEAITTHYGNDPLNYKWFINDNIEGTGNPFSYRFRPFGNNTSAVEFTIKAIAQNAAGCGDTSLPAKLVMQPVPTPHISVSPSLVLHQPDYEFTFKDLAPSGPDKTWLWDMGDRSLQTRSEQQISYQYGDTGTYYVKLLVTDLFTGCKATDSVKVAILHVPGYLQVPNAMCPGCSNFSLRKFLPLGKGLKKYRLSIYTTWGQKIFETTSLNADGSPNMAWDGTFNGKALQQDVYSWQIEATYINETEWKGMIYPGSNKPVKAGFITVIK